MAQTHKEMLSTLRRKRSIINDEIRSLSARRDNAQRAQLQAIAVGDNDFYFRVGLDFRGRLYYRSAHLNPQMGDDVKAVLMLADKKPLGEHGFKWLMWGIASAAGYDKADFESRVTWAIDRIAKIEQSVKDPMNSELFSEVLSGGEPALYLQRATELVNALNSGSIYTYETSITIAMDATCSGLQILSAVAKDLDGGCLVNINKTPEGQERKADVYDHILNLLLDKYSKRKDAFSKWIKTHGLQRRFTKRAVMTLPYSATVGSAAGYVKDELQGNPEKGETPYQLPETREDRIELLQAAKTLAGQKPVSETELTKFIENGRLYEAMARVIAIDIHETCRVTLPAAMRLLAFFQHIPQEMHDHAVWHTPDGLQVKQRYGKKMRKKVGYSLSYPDPNTGEILKKPVQRIYEYFDQSKKNLSKSENGMPPNWVHSLDGTLVRRTVLMSPFPIICIHDSFAAHPADCEDLARILREQFVWLVEQEPLPSLCDELNSQLGTHVFSAEPLMSNTWDPKDALESKFLFC